VRTTRLVWNRDKAKLEKPSSRKTSDPFIRGPIPAGWLQAAGRLPGKSLHVGAALWQLAGLRSTRDNLPLSTERVQAFGVTRQAKSRALAELQRAGLVSVESRPGRTPLVSILKAGKPCRA